MVTVPLGLRGLSRHFSLGASAGWHREAGRHGRLGRARVDGPLASIGTPGSDVPSSAAVRVLARADVRAGGGACHRPVQVCLDGPLESRQSGLELMRPRGGRVVARAAGTAGRASDRPARDRCGFVGPVGQAARQSGAHPVGCRWSGGRGECAQHRPGRPAHDAAEDAGAARVAGLQGQGGRPGASG